MAMRLPSSGPWLLRLVAVTVAASAAISCKPKPKAPPANAVPRPVGTAAPGFKEILKDPGYDDEAEEAQREMEKILADTAKWSDEQVANAVTRYLFHTASSNQAWSEQQILRSLKTRVQPVLLKYLAEKERYPVWVKPTGENPLPEAPFHRACDLLGERPPDAAVPLLAPFLNDPDKSIRQQAALAIAKTGSLESVPHIKKALADPEEYVRGYALMGLSWAAKETKSLRPGVAKELYPDVKRLAEKGDNGDEFPEVLVAFDPEAAKQFFLSPEFFRADSKILHQALNALGNASIEVPAERLVPLITELRGTVLEYPRDYTLSQALRLLGRHRRPEDLELLKSLAAHSNEDVAEGASTALVAWHGLEGFDQRLYKLEEAKGYGALNRPQQHYSAVFMFDAEVCNGGIEQYFLNSSGSQWKDALEGLKVMKDAKRTAILEKAAAKFGKDGPSTDRDKRQDQLAALIRKDEDSFEALNDQYYDITPPIEAVMNAYVLENPEAFR